MKIYPPYETRYYLKRKLYIRKAPNKLKVCKSRKKKLDLIAFHVHKREDEKPFVLILFLLKLTSLITMKICRTEYFKFFALRII